MSDSDPTENPETGEVSEVTSLDTEAADTPLSDTEHAAGQPDDDVQEGKETGPDADQFRERDIR